MWLFFVTLLCTHEFRVKVRLCNKIHDQGRSQDFEGVLDCRIFQLLNYFTTTKMTYRSYIRQVSITLYYIKYNSNLIIL